MNSEYRERVKYYMFYIVLAVAAFAFLFWGGFYVSSSGIKAEEAELRFQSYLNSHRDSITAYLDGTEVDFTKMDLAKYSVTFNEDLTEMYMTRSDNSMYHRLPENAENEQ